MPGHPTATLAELVERLIAARTGEPAFADDLERIQAEQPAASKFLGTGAAEPERPWPRH